MIIRLSTAAVRLSIVVLAFVLAAALSYSGIRNALAAHYAGLNTLPGYQHAASLEPGDARYWYLLGRYWQYNLTDPDTPRAIRAYQTALGFDVHASDTWLDLATAYESEGHLSEARSAFLQAARMYPLSPEVSWRFGNFLIRRGEFDAAVAQIRHAVEVDPKRAAAAFALGVRFEPDAKTALEQVLPHNKEAYLTAISTLADQQETEQAMVVWSALASLHPQLQVSDSYTLFNALLRKHEVKQAQLVWNQALSFSGVTRPPDAPGSLVWDGGFESDIPQGGFTWYYAPFVNGVQVAFDEKEKHSGKRSLRLTFNGLQNVSFGDVCQYVAVEPSTPYRFSAWVKTHELSTDQGVRFAFYARSPSGNTTVWTDDVKGTQPWTQIEMPWTSPSGVQELRICVTRVPSSSFDSKIHGSAWIDDVSLVPQAAENPKP